MSGFVIYALPVSAGMLGIAPLPGRDGQAAVDLAHLSDWKPALVITLTTQAEHARFGMADLGPAMQERGARWAHLPVADMSVPGPRQSGDWLRIEEKALSALRGGGRVLIHCLGGCGRSGMAALRLMIRAGEVPEVALSRLRSIRPCAVETPAQMDWARGTKRRLSPGTFSGETGPDRA